MTSMNAPIILKEYDKVQIPASRISREEGKRLWQEFGNRISVIAPSFKTDDQWELISQGYVGYIPFSEHLGFYLEPKVPLQNLFGMWEYAYRLKTFEFLSDAYQCESLQEFYEQLASVLAKRVLDRGRKGYYREYISKSEDLSFLRGKLDLQHMMQKPWEPRPRCKFQENTADIDENRILAWTLYTILRSGFCTERVLPAIRKCYRSIGHAATVLPYRPDDCMGRFYNRLNQDYHPLHALCRFFLENTGPSYEIGEHTMLPFLVDMADLFELFVAEWLRTNLPSEYELISQENVNISQKGEVNFRIDLVLYESATQTPICVLDTKYKAPESPASSDVSQVGFYAVLKNCSEAILIYPRDLQRPLNENVNGIHVRTATFSLDGNLEQEGKKFLQTLLGNRS